VKVAEEEKGGARFSAQEGKFLSIVLMWRNPSSGGVNKNCFEKKKKKKSKNEKYRGPGRDREGQIIQLRKKVAGGAINLKAAWLGKKFLRERAHWMAKIGGGGIIKCPLKTTDTRRNGTEKGMSWMGPPEKIRSWRGGGEFFKKRTHVLNQTASWKAGTGGSDTKQQKKKRD